MALFPQKAGRSGVFARVGSFLLVCIAVTLHQCAAQGSGPWQQMASVLERIKPPVFPDKDFTVTEFGARGDGVTDCSEAFTKAIETCAQAGGGRVVVPAGNFLAGRIYLKSNVNLHLEKNAVIRFQTDPGRYLPPVLTRWEGVECMNYSPLIYAYQEQNIAITGSGTLDGCADSLHWWPWKGSAKDGWKEGTPNQVAARNQLFDMGEKNVPVEQRTFGEGSYLRPNFIQPYKCRNILIDGVTIVRSPMWEIHPVLCENITVRNVFIDTHGPNNDGCDPESSRDVLISGCHFDTGDDCIAIKSGRNNDGRRLHTPSENIVIQKCMFKDGHGGVTIGSEVSGGTRNVFAEDCEMKSPVLYSALRIKSNAVRGGTVENINMRHIKVGLVDKAVFDVDLYYEEGRNGTFLPAIRNITVENMTVDSCKVALNLVGYKEAPLQNITLKDCEFVKVSKGYKIENVEGLKITGTTINGKELKP